MGIDKVQAATELLKQLEEILKQDEWTKCENKENMTTVLEARADIFNAIKKMDRIIKNLLGEE